MAQPVSQSAVCSNVLSLLQVASDIFPTLYTQQRPFVISSLYDTHPQRTNSLSVTEQTALTCKPTHESPSENKIRPIKCIIP
jgi:hypothetical protein